MIDINQVTYKDRVYPVISYWHKEDEAFVLIFTGDRYLLIDTGIYLNAGEWTFLRHIIARKDYINDIDTICMESVSGKGTLQYDKIDKETFRMYLSLTPASKNAGSWDIEVARQAGVSKAKG